MTELEKVWLACAIDCEGNIRLYKHSVGGTYGPYIRISNTDYDLVAKCKTTTNKGKIALVKPRYGRRPLWEWRVNNLRDCLEILQEIYPYLVIKQKSARQIIRYCDYKLRAKNRHKRSAFVEKVIATGSEQEAEDMIRRFG